MRLPLSGVRVLELAGIGPVPFAGMVFAGMGADVVVVDRIGGRPDPDVMLRAVGRGKRSIAIDLKQPEGAGTLLRLVEQSNVLIEGFRPGVAERLGVGPEECLGVNGDLIYGRMTGWGHNGPLAQMAGHDINYIALVGALDAIGSEEHSIPPLNLVGDYGGGAMFLVAGVLAALVAGSGGVVDTAMVDGAASLMAPFYAMRGLGLWGDARADNLLDGGAPFYTAYPTADGKQVAVGALEPQFYSALIDGLGLDGADLPDRLDKEQWPRLRERLAGVFATRTRDEWEAVFTGTDACVTPVLSMAEAPRHPANVARAVFVGADEPLPAPAPRFGDELPADLAAAPLPGADTDRILADAGVTSSEIERLRSAGVVG